LRFKNSGFGGSGTADFEVPEPQNLRPNKNNISKKEERKNEKSQSFNHACACAENAPLSENRESRDFQSDRTRGGRDGQTDSGSELSFILDGCELGSFSPDVALLFENAVERLYYSQSVKIGNAILPQDRVRSRLYLLDGDILREAERKLSEYGGRRIRNKTGYAMTTIFNCIAEREDYLPRSFGASQYGERRGAPCY
ncbi:MAG: hypothetical protein J6X53_02125, partial [Abditibacteriota bacterium]|nr:hypothetical protein [Abditibacteriota bacterium]